MLGLLIFILSLVPVGVNLVSTKNPEQYIDELTRLSASKFRRQDMPMILQGRESRRLDVLIQTIRPSQSILGSVLPFIPCVDIKQRLFPV